MSCLWAVIGYSGYIMEAYIYFGVIKEKSYGNGTFILPQCTIPKKSIQWWLDKEEEGLDMLELEKEGDSCMSIFVQIFFSLPSSPPPYNKLFLDKFERWNAKPIKFLLSAQLHYTE